MSNTDERGTDIEALLAKWDDTERPDGWNAGDEHHLATLVIDALRHATEWATAVSDDPKTIVVAKSETSAANAVEGWNSHREVRRGDRARGLLFKRTVGPWIEVQP